MTEPEIVNERPGGPRRRKDMDGRDRIAQLEARQRRFANRVWASVCVIFVTLVVGFAMQQDSRLDASEDACKRDNTQARTFRTLVADPAAEAKIADSFPIVHDCRAAARARTGIWLDILP